MTAEGMINYEALAHEAMRGVVRTVLQRTARTGLPGEHHFYISFDTTAAGVSMSRRLKEKYPEEMTIVLQHRFWDLSVSDDRFEVKLTFDGIPERLVIPFQALKVFYDPSVRYGLQFEALDSAGETAAETFGSGSEPRPISDRINAAQRPGGPPRKRPVRKPRSDRADAGAEGREGDRSDAADQRSAHSEGTPRPGGLPAPASGDADQEGEKPAPANGGAQIVSLSDFRKK